MQPVNRIAKTLLGLSTCLFAAGSIAASVPVPNGNGDGAYPVPKPKVIETVKETTISTAVELS